MNLFFPIILTTLGLVAADDKRAPSFFTAMRGKKSYQPLPNYDEANVELRYIDRLPEEFSNNPFLVNSKRYRAELEFPEQEGNISI